MTEQTDPLGEAMAFWTLLHAHTRTALKNLHDDHIEPHDRPQATAIQALLLAHTMAHARVRALAPEVADNCPYDAGSELGEADNLYGFLTGFQALNV